MMTERIKNLAHNEYYDMFAMLDKLPSIKCDGKYGYNGNPVPRVTDIIKKCIGNDSYMNWANSLGFKHISYNKEMQRVANIGTVVHKYIDNFLSDKKLLYISDITAPEAGNAYMSFLKWYSNIPSVEVVMHEEPLICKWFGGTLDSLFKIDNSLYLIDYKTSNIITYKHFLQLAAYRFILEYEYGINIDNALILQLAKYEIGFNEYLVNLSVPEYYTLMNNCEKTFLSMVISYYNLEKVDSDFSYYKKGKRNNE